MRSITHIMIHHSLTEDSGSVSWAAIERFHKEIQNYNDIGYHFGIELVINPYVQHWLSPYKYQALIGRPIEMNGAACPQESMNKKAIHVCCVGNYDIEVPEKELYERLYERIIKPHAKEFKIPPSRWIGHRDANPNKSCPGRNFDLDKLRKMGG